MRDSMKKLMHNVELLVVTTGAGNWRSALDTVSKSKSLLAEIEREILSEIKAEQEKRNSQDRTARG